MGALNKIMDEYMGMIVMDVNSTDVEIISLDVQSEGGVKAVNKNDKPSALF